MKGHLINVKIIQKKMKKFKIEKFFKLKYNTINTYKKLSLKIRGIEGKSEMKGSHSVN